MRLRGRTLAEFQNPTALLDPAALSKLGPLELIAARVVEGFLSGKHRSPFKGSSIEFAEHRLYTPGDEVRLLDWRVLGRSDRYYIKQYEKETNLQAMLVLDASGSMGFGASTSATRGGSVSKLRYAQMACACLARMMLHQGDAVGLSVIDTKVRHHVPPRSNPSHLRVLLEAMSRCVPGGETSLAKVLNDLAKRIKRRGMVMLCTDAFDEVEPLLNALRLLRTRGHEVLLFHVLAPEELSFSFTRWARFECLEVAGMRIELDPASVRGRYLERVKIFLDQLRQGCGEIGCDYLPLTTDKPLGDALSYYLARRAARMK